MLTVARQRNSPRPVRASYRLRLSQAKACQLTFVLILLALWAWISLTGKVSPLLLPPPTDVVAQLWLMLGGRDMWHNILVTDA
jgi:ABC-type nitrate/sulfonate/bicarbonate transport system permease component